MGDFHVKLLRGLSHLTLLGDLESPCRGWGWGWGAAGSLRGTLLCALCCRKPEFGLCCWLRFSSTSTWKRLVVGTGAACSVLHLDFVVCWTFGDLESLCRSWGCGWGAAWSLRGYTIVRIVLL